MAKKWTVGEAWKALKEGDKEARDDIARRFPLFATATQDEIIESLELITARQIERRLRGDIGQSSDGENEEEAAEEKEEKKTKKKSKKDTGKKKKDDGKKKKDTGKKKKKEEEEEPEVDDDDEDIDDLFDDEDEGDEE